MPFAIRQAQLRDLPVLEDLIRASVRVLQAQDYTTEQREGALGSVFGVDRLLILDGTYFVVEEGSAIVACGGWSRRKTLFGGDNAAQRDDGFLDPATGAAKIRAFFVLPGWSRKGLGALIMQTSEAAARAAGFSRLELGATLTGVPLYRAHGFIEENRVELPLPNGAFLPIVHMTKRLDNPLP